MLHYAIVIITDAWVNVVGTMADFGYKTDGTTPFGYANMFFNCVHINADQKKIDRFQSFYDGKSLLPKMGVMPENAGPEMDAKKKAQCQLYLELTTSWSSGAVDVEKFKAATLPLFTDDIVFLNGPGPQLKGKDASIDSVVGFDAIKTLVHSPEHIILPDKGTCRS